MEGGVEDLLTEEGLSGGVRVNGVVLGGGESPVFEPSKDGHTMASALPFGQSNVVRTAHVILTTGTFLRAMLHIGPITRVSGGRIGDRASVGLSQTLQQKLGFTVSRLTTSTPPRIDGRTINYSVCEPQKGTRCTSALALNRIIATVSLLSLRLAQAMIRLARSRF